MPEIIDSKGNALRDAGQIERAASRRDGQPLVRLLPADRQRHQDVSRDLGPEEVDRILTTANRGSQEEQARLAAEILEKDWDISQAIRTRVAAVIGTPWEVAPTAATAAARRVSDFVTEALRAAEGDEERGLTGFSQLLGDMLSSYLPGFSVNEIVWTAGGAGIAGFQFIPQQHFTFSDSFAPQLRGKQPDERWQLPPQRFIVHRYRHRPGDIARGGMIRPLAWLYACKRLALVDMLRYLEKFGTPFLLARLEPHVWETERHRIAQMIRRFGSDGGGVFSTGVDLDMVQPTGGAANGRLFLEVLDYFERAISRVVLGQTSTSDSRNSNRSTASVHELVRQDLRIDDCAALAQTLRHAVVRPLVTFNFGPDAPVPNLQFRVSSEPDLERDARVLRDLAQAGYRVKDLDRLKDRFGYEFVADGGEEVAP